ncbi:pectin lyase fold/virulence factor [Aspergillus karnatakaensis]|uniref:polysaccharide lyase family 1 protein n=1 Tax=Aspergillus karnatakaensis TaxID=1810916 RepID=UPI003CCCA2EF
MKLPLALVIPFLSGLTAAIPAFPGASGFGAEATGGRGGEVYIVTNLEDSGEGSLRDAVSETDRIVVFAVGGVINIEDRIVVSKRVTILGQTAPGDGITVYGNGWSFSNADDAIVRYLRIRMGRGGDSGKDGITIAEGSNMIFDHLSVSWGRDETFSISGTAENVTVQDTIIAQGLETHSCGGLMETDGGISLFRNLYIDNKTRNPKVKGVNDFTNNLVYNWGGGGGYIAGDSSGQSYAHIIANYFISGPSTSKTAFTRGNANFHGYVENNYYDPDQDGTLNGNALGPSSSNYGGMEIVDTKYDYPPPETLLTPEEVVAYVTENVGASLVRDDVDTYLIAEVLSYGSEGALIDNESDIGGVGEIDPGTARTDTDGDGIPDDAEAALGTDPNVADSLELHESGYTYLEVWANSLVEEISVSKKC